jgi:putative ABC transport system permease protein
MLSNYLKIAIRGLSRNKGHSVINVAGLAIGMASAFAIGAYVWHETHYDRQWSQADRIYRVVTDYRSTDSERHSAGTPVPLGAALRNELPEAEHVARFWQAYQPVLRFGDHAFREDELCFADPSVFNIFDFSFLRGTSAALNAPRSIVLTQSFARKYFGDVDPVGRTLEYDGFPEGKLSLTVRGVLADLPSNTALRFSALISINGVTTEIDNWGSTKDIWTFVLVRSGANVSELEGKLRRFAEAHFGKPDPRQRSLHLEALSEVHLDPVYGGGFTTAVSRTSLTLASLIGFSILLLACINFTNLTTARALTRSRDMGVRKVLGARRSQLIIQVFGEILILAVTASSIALVALDLLGPTVESFAGTSLQIPWPILALGVGTITVCATAIAGIYPALLLSGFDPVRVLTGRSGGRQRSTSRKVLVVVQFAVSVALLSATFVIARQLEFIRSKELGITRDHIVVVPGTQHFDAFRAELMTNSHVADVTESHRVPLSALGRDTRTLRLEAQDEKHQFHTFIVDNHFLETYGISLIAGRSLPTVTAEGHHPFLINERALAEFGWRTAEEALGQRVVWSGKYRTGEIVGVVRDFTVESLHEEIPPVVLTTMPDEQWWRDYTSIRIRQGSDIADILGSVEKTWKRLTPEGAFEYRFLEDEFANLHRTDTRLAEFVGLGTTAAIVIACLGLLGLAASAAQQRTKEIGIRKVLGSTVGELVRLLAKEFVNLVVIANLLAWPLAYLATQRYLESFAYHVGFSPWAFLAAAASALIVALIVIAGQVYRAARTNPVEALRYE